MKRKIRGIDWHAWAWKTSDEDFKLSQRLFHWAESKKPTRMSNPTTKGKWVRVKFVEVDK